MTDSAAQDFLSGFDGIELPTDFNDRYEIIECMSSSDVGSTLLVRRRDTGDLCVAKTGDVRGDVLGGRHIDGVPDFIETLTWEQGSITVREYARGITADKLIGSGTLTTERCVAIVARLCDILSELHSLDPPVIHRDLKPANIVVDGESVMLIDFGIAREYDETATADTIYLGTREFAPPEQFGYSQTDNRTDIYSLGAVLYCLLTGRTDVAGANEQVHDKRLAQIIARCCAFAPKDRFSNAEQVRRALTAGHSKKLAAAAVCVAAGLLLLAGGFCIGRFTDVLPMDGTLSPLSGSKFADAQMESAVRAALGVDDSTELTQDMLDTVTELYIMGDSVAGDRDEYQQLSNNWYDEKNYGEIATLEDVSKLPNLTTLCLGAQPRLDLTPLSQAEKLSFLALKQMDSGDLTPLAELPALTNIDLSGGYTDDLSPLGDCKRLSEISLHAVITDDYSFLEKLDNYRYLGLTSIPVEDILPHLEGKRVWSLHLGSVGLSSIHELDAIEGIERLVLTDMRISDISGIENFPLVTYLDLSQNYSIADLSPLLEMPNLLQVTLSWNVREAAAELEKSANFEIVIDE